MVVRQELEVSLNLLFAESYKGVEIKLVLQAGGLKKNQSLKSQEHQTMANKLTKRQPLNFIVWQHINYHRSLFHPIISYRGRVESPVP